MPTHEKTHLEKIYDQKIKEWNDNSVKTLSESDGLGIYTQIPLKQCNHCGEPLPNKIDYYPHPGGWLIESIHPARRYWLSITCPYCGYQLSLWKLGYGRDPLETESMKEKIVIWQQHAIDAYNSRKKQY